LTPTSAMSKRAHQAAELDIVHPERLTAATYHGLTWAVDLGRLSVADAL
jgi:hypothetical protein